LGFGGVKTTEAAAIYLCVYLCVWKRFFFVKVPEVIQSKLSPSTILGCLDSLLGCLCLFSFVKSLESYNVNKPLHTTWLP
jgi:hypothetical protein